MTIIIAYFVNRQLRYFINGHSRIFGLCSSELVNIALVVMGAEMFYIVILALQVLFYLMAFAGWLMSLKGRKNKLLYTAYYFIFMNLNVFRGMAYLQSHHTSGAWEKAKRS